MCKHGSHNKHNPFAMFMSVCAIGVRKINCDVEHGFQDFTRQANFILCHSVRYRIFFNCGPVKIQLHVGGYVHI